MKNKLLSIALMVVAAITIIAAPIVNDSSGDDFTTAPQTSTTTTTTTTTTVEAATTTTASQSSVTASGTSEQESVTTTLSETGPTTTTTTTVTTTKKPETTTTTKATTTTKVTTTKKPQTTTAKVTTTTKATTTKKPQTTTTKVTTKKPTTTTTTAKKPIENNAPDGTPVKEHGQLSVKGANIVDQNGNKFQIIGMSTHGIMWEDFSDILTYDSLKVLRDDWGINTIRIAMYTEEWGGYTTGGNFAKEAKEIVINGVKTAEDLGLYVIIDWHILKDGNPLTHKDEAVAFFKEMSSKYKDSPNVIYEICNEPNGNVNWASVKKYAEEVIKEIRKYDSDAIIICGTPNWSQDIDKAEQNRLSDKNTVYALHFYANTHTDWLRNRVQSCYNKGLPILVSEFGTCDASGNGGFNAGQTKKWLGMLDSNNIGYLNWSACGKSETASAFKNGTNLKSIKAGTSQLTESGKLIRELYRKRAGIA